LAENEKMVKEYEGEFARKNEYISSLEKQIHDQNRKNHFVYLS